MLFLSVYVRADTFTANEVKKQRKKYIINTFDMVHIYVKSPKNIKIWIFNERVPGQGYLYIFSFFTSLAVKVSARTFKDKKTCL